MIVRVQGSGQYRLEDGAVSELNGLDSELQKAVESRDELTVSATLYKMIAMVQIKGQPVGVEEVLPSDAILPHGDMTFDEIVALLKEEGLVPG